MTTELLIDAIVRQTTVFIAQLATAGGARTPIADVAEQVFLELVRELERQGVSRKVAADMFGMALRTFRRRIQRLSESQTVSNRSLWEPEHRQDANVRETLAQRRLRQARIDARRGYKRNELILDKSEKIRAKGLELRVGEREEDIAHPGDGRGIRQNPLIHELSHRRPLRRSPLKSAWRRIPLRRRAELAVHVVSTRRHGPPDTSDQQRARKPCAPRRSNPASSSENAGCSVDTPGTSPGNAGKRARKAPRKKPPENWAREPSPCDACTNKTSDDLGVVLDGSELKTPGRPLFGAGLRGYDVTLSSAKNLVRRELRIASELRDRNAALSEDRFQILVPAFAQ